MLNEAVRVASQPASNTGVQKFESPTKIQEVQKPIPSSTNPIMEMLNQTKASMTSEEYKNVYAGTSDMVQKPNFATSMANQMGMTHSNSKAPGLDISKFDFVQKAGSVYSRSIEKDKQKHGVV